MSKPEHDYQARLRKLVEELRAAAEHMLLDGQDVSELRLKLDEALEDAKRGKGDRVGDQAAKLRMRLEPAIALLKAADDLDPHSLGERELDELFRRSPKELVREALHEGDLRERRMILQAKEAHTNRRLVYVAVGAACAALMVPILERALAVWPP